MKKIHILFFMCLLSAVTVSAKHKEYKGEMIITPLQLEQTDDSLHIRVDFDFRNVKVGARRSISLIPILTAPDREQKLPEVMVKGRVDYLTSKRELALMNKADRRAYEKNAPYAIVKGYKSNGQKQVAYRKAILFEPWMKEARLDIRQDLCGCGYPPRPFVLVQLIDKVQLEQVAPYIPYLAYVKPMAEGVKKREMIGEAYVDFVVSKIDIRPEYMDNPMELKKIADMVMEARNDSTITVAGISVIGYASPEGTLKFNKYLSEARAKALVDYLTPRFDYPKEMYHVEFGGENWDGLLAKVEASDMTYRDEVIDVLTNVPAEINYQTDVSRKKSLMSLRGGEPYRYLLKTYFPGLRKAICRIDYEVRGFSVAEAKEIMKTDPQKLSLDEMYQVASTYETGSQEFIDAFKTAANMFPQDETANLNAASAVLSQKDAVVAVGYLEKVKGSSPEYDNAMGVLHMLRENYTEAETYFTKAADKGLESAKQNLEELKKQNQNK